MRARGKTPISTPALTAWIMTCAILCVAFLGYGASGAKSTAGGSFVLQALYNLPIAAVLALLLHVVFRLRLPRWFGWLGLGVLYLGLLGSSAWSTARQRAEQEAAQAAARQVAALQAAADAASAAAAAEEANRAADAQRTTELVKAMLERSAAPRRDYERELEAIGWGRVLDGARLRQDASLERTRAMLERAKGLAAAARERTPQLFAEMRRSIEASELSGPAKRRLLAEYDKSAERDQAQALEGWLLEEKVLAGVEAATQYLHANRPAWGVERGQLSFRRPADRERFSALLDAVKSLTDQQERLRMAATRRAQLTLSRLGG
jgi:hypothetical protein